jgi:hypothetical protein
MGGIDCAESARGFPAAVCSPDPKHDAARNHEPEDYDTEADLEQVMF